MKIVLLNYLIISNFFKYENVRKIKFLDKKRSENVIVWLNSIKVSQRFKIKLYLKLITDLINITVSGTPVWPGTHFNSFKLVLQFGFIIFQYSDSFLEVDKLF